MIDEAEALNTKKQNEGIGLVSRDDYNGDEGDGGHDDKAIAGAKADSDQLLSESGRGSGSNWDKGVALGSSKEEEEKLSPEVAALFRLKSQQDPLSARHKIQEMGLGKTVSEAALPRLADTHKYSDFASIMHSKNNERANNLPDGSDSDDLF